MTPERIEEVRKILSGMNQSSQLFPITVGDLNSLLADLEEAQQESKMWKRKYKGSVQIGDANYDAEQKALSELAEAQQTIARLTAEVEESELYKPLYRMDAEGNLHPIEREEE